MTLLTFAMFLAGFVLLIVGAELLVRGASRLAVAAGISPLVVGLTVVAYGTSAPELAVTIRSTYESQPDIAIGNVVGSNISNLLLVLGISALVSPLVVARSLVRTSVPLMIGVSVLVLLMGLDGRIGRLDGVLLTIGAILFTAVTVYRSRIEMRSVQEKREQNQFGKIDKSKVPLSRVSDIVARCGLIVGGLVLLVLGATWLVQGAVTVAELLGVSQLIIGLTIVAVGTSLPEIATSIVAGMRGQRDIAVGNVVGSNIFNLFFVLGVCSLVSPDGIAVSPSAMRFDLPVMIAVSIASLPIFFTKYRIDRWEGLFFLSYYIAYTAYLYLQAVDHPAFVPLRWVMSTLVLPLTCFALLVFVFRQWRSNRAADD